MQPYPNAPSSAPFSCTAVVVTLETREILHSHVYFASAPETFFSTRAGIRSTTVPTLLSSLQQASSRSNSAVPDLVKDVLVGSFTHPNIELGTSRTPSFGPELLNPGYGFRALGKPSKYYPSFPDGNVNVYDDVLAVHDAYDSHAAIRFERLWRPYGVDLKSHFILIFILPQGLRNFRLEHPFLPELHGAPQSPSSPGQYSSFNSPEYDADRGGSVGTWGSPNVT
jgi:hypothetical protein